MTTDPFVLKVKNTVGSPERSLPLRPDRVPEKCSKCVVCPVLSVTTRTTLSLGPPFASCSTPGIAAHIPSEETAGAALANPQGKASLGLVRGMKDFQSSMVIT